MGWWPFGRRSTADKSVETLLAEANVASPTPGRFRWRSRTSSSSPGAVPW